MGNVPSRAFHMINSKWLHTSVFDYTDADRNFHEASDFTPQGANLKKVENAKDKVCKEILGLGDSVWRNQNRTTNGTKLI